METLPVATNGPMTDNPTGLVTSREAEGVIAIELPNLLPTDSVAEVHEPKMRRTKLAVRITSITIEEVDNGYTVKIPNAGLMGIFETYGSTQVFTEKEKMLEFVAMVIGQVTYQYRENEICDVATDVPSEGVQAANVGG